MSLVPGKIDVIRQPGVDVTESGDLDAADVVVEAADEGGDRPEKDAGGNILRFEHDDGTITIA